MKKIDEHIVNSVKDYLRGRYGEVSNLKDTISEFKGDFEKQCKEYLKIVDDDTKLWIADVFMNVALCQDYLNQALNALGRKL